MNGVTHMGWGKPAGALHHNWKGGIRPNLGYTCVLLPAHPRADCHGYVREHLLVAEKALGRPIPKKHPVHHVDENRANNTPTNLVLCENQAYHSLLHTRAAALAACGNPNARRCHICHSYDDQANMVVRNNGYGGSGRHRACHAAKMREYSQLKKDGPNGMES